MRALTTLLALSGWLVLSTSAAADPWHVTAYVVPGSSTPGQPQPYVFYVSVSDDTGAPVTGLSPLSFRVGALTCYTHGCGFDDGTVSNLVEPVDQDGAGADVTKGLYSFSVTPTIVQGFAGEFVLRVFQLNAPSAPATPLHPSLPTITPRAQLLVPTNVK
jgi:hypothetical protein